MIFEYLNLKSTRSNVRIFLTHSHRPLLRPFHWASSIQQQQQPYSRGSRGRLLFRSAFFLQALLPSLSSSIAQISCVLSGNVAGGNDIHETVVIVVFIRNLAAGLIFHCHMSRHHLQEWYPRLLLSRRWRKRRRNQQTTEESVWLPCSITLDGVMNESRQ